MPYNRTIDFIYQPLHTIIGMQPKGKVKDRDNNESMRLDPGISLTGIVLVQTGLKPPH